MKRNFFRKLSGREELDRIKSERYDPYFYESNSFNFILLAIFLGLWSLVSISIAFQDYNISSMIAKWQSNGISSLPPSTFDPEALIDFSARENFECLDIVDLVNEQKECPTVLKYYDEYSKSQNISFFLFLILFVDFIICMFIFGSFIHRSSRNLLALKSSEQRFSPEMSVFWFFIPGMNFFRPWQILKELFKGSDPSVEDNWQYNGDVHFSVHVWAVFYLVACIFNPITVPRIWFSDRENIGDIISTYKILIISDIILFLLGILAIIVVFKLHKLQEKKRNIVGLVTVYPKKPLDPIEELLNNDDDKK